MVEKFPLYRWWKAHEIERIWPETFLKTQELYCVSACARFIEMNFKKDHAWVLSSNGEAASALLLHSKGTLFPVFNGQTEIYIPAFLLRALKNIDLYAILGVAQETQTLEKILDPLGFKAREYVDYNLMAYHKSNPPRQTAYEGAWSGKKFTGSLSLRKANEADLDNLFLLHSAYEKEEVLPQGAVFNPAASRLNLAKIIKNEECIVAEIDGVIAGKINTNARSYSCYQLGGVYVAPEFRGQGIATRMTSAFTRLLLSRGKDITLYVNKDNKAAGAVYKNCGYQNIADYRIVYL
jgi:ribosomal protein S18 acetylase RimI-like enzyme